MSTQHEVLDSLNLKAWNHRELDTRYALELANQAAQMATIQSEHLQYLSALRTKSHCAYLLADYDTAIACADELLHLAEEQKNDALVAFALNTLGNSHFRCGRYHNALSYLFRTLGLRLQSKDLHGEASVMNNIGNAYYALSDYMTAKDYHLRSFELKKTLGDKKGQANSLTNLGTVYHLIGDYQKAISAHQEALDIYTSLKEKRGLSHALNNIGNVQRDIGNFNAALDTHFKCLSLKRELGDRHGESLALLNLGKTCVSQGDLARASEYLGKSKSIATDLGDQQTELYVMECEGALSRMLGKYEEAMSFYLSSIAIAEQVDARSDKLTCLNEIGKLQRLMGQYTSAMDYHQKALMLAEELGEKESEAAVMRELGVVYLSMGDAVNAIKYLFQSLERAEQLQNRALIADSLLAIGDSAILLKETERAESCYYKSHDLYSEIGHQLNQTEAIYRLGVLKLALRDFSSAERFLSLALGAAEGLSAVSLQGDLCSAISELAKTQGDLDRHLTFHRRAKVLKQDVVNTSKLLRIQSLIEAMENKSLSKTISSLHANEFQTLLQKAHERASEKISISQPQVIELPPINTHQVVVQTLGTFRVCVDGKELSTEVWKRKKSRDVFKYLLVHYKQHVSVDSLLDALWGECNENNKNLLLTAISHIRKAIEPSKTPLFLQSKDKSYRLDFGENAAIDFITFQASIKEAKSVSESNAHTHYEKALTIYGGKFLPEDESEEWSTFLRENLHDGFLSALSSLAQLMFRAAQYDTSLALAKRLQSYDQTSEIAYEIQFQILKSQGKTADIQKLFRQCENAYKHELGINPPTRFRQYLT